MLWLFDLKIEMRLIYRTVAKPTVVKHLNDQIAIYPAASQFADIEKKISLNAAIFTHHFIQMMTSIISENALLS